MAGAWRNQSCSLVRFKRVAETGKPAVAERRGTLAGHSLGGGSVTRGTSAVALGDPQRRVSQGEDEICTW